MCIKFLKTDIVVAIIGIRSPKIIHYETQNLTL